MNRPSQEMASFHVCKMREVRFSSPPGTGGGLGSHHPSVPPPTSSSSPPARLRSLGFIFHQGHLRNPGIRPEQVTQVSGRLSGVCSPLPPRKVRLPLGLGGSLLTEAVKQQKRGLQCGPQGPEEAREIPQASVLRKMQLRSLSFPAQGPCLTMEPACFFSPTEVDSGPGVL